MVIPTPSLLSLYSRYDKIIYSMNTTTSDYPLSLADSFQKLAKEAVRLVKEDVKVVGLGSGSTVSFIVREMLGFQVKNQLNMYQLRCKSSWRRKKARLGSLMKIGFRILTSFLMVLIR